MRYKNREDTEHVFIINVWHLVVVALSVRHLALVLYTHTFSAADKEWTRQKSSKGANCCGSFSLTCEPESCLFIVLRNATGPSTPKPYLGGIHQREQRAAFPCCIIVRHALRDTSISSTRPECNVTGCRIKDRPSLMPCTRCHDIHS